MQAYGNLKRYYVWKVSSFLKHLLFAMWGIGADLCAGVFVSGTSLQGVFVRRSFCHSIAHVSLTDPFMQLDNRYGVVYMSLKETSVSVNKGNNFCQHLTLSSHNKRFSYASHVELSYIIFDHAWKLLC